MAISNLHIKKIRVENYKSLKASEIEFKEGLNIIIGKNGAGKSNMLDFVYRYGSRTPFSFSFRNIRTSNANYSVTLQYLNKRVKNIFSYSMERLKSNSQNVNAFTHTITLNKTEGAKEILKDRKVSFKNVISTKILSKSLIEEDEIVLNEFRIFGNIKRRYVSFIIPVDAHWIFKPSRIVIDRDNENLIDINDEEYSDFGFFTSLEFEILSKEFKSLHLVKEVNVDSVKEEFSSILSEYLNGTEINFILNQYTLIKEIRFNPNINIYSIEQNVIIENIYIEFLIDNDWLPWSYLSDGTKRMFYLISEALSLEKGVLLIEEPELGIHPHQLYKIMDFLKEQSRDKQVIISTHSPLVLDILEEKELDKIIIAKYDNGTKFNHLTKEEINKAKRYMNEVGELSYYWLHSDLEK